MSRKQKKRIDRLRQAQAHQLEFIRKLQGLLKLAWKQEQDDRARIALLTDELKGYRQILHCRPPVRGLRHDTMHYEVVWTQKEIDILGEAKAYDLVVHAFHTAIMTHQYERQRAEAETRFQFTQTPEGLRPCPRPR